MATIDARSFTWNIVKPPYGCDLTITDTLEIAADELDLNDIIRLLKMPRYCQIVGGGVEYDTLSSSGGTASLNVFDGDATSQDLVTDFPMATDSFIDAVNGTAGTPATGWMGFEIDDDDWVLRLENTADATTPTAGTLRWWVKINFNTIKVSNAAQAA